MSQEEKDPRWRLTRFLTEPLNWLIGKGKEGKEEDKIPGLFDLNTEFPTAEAVKLQLFLRELGEDFDFDSFNKEADRISRIMWSFGRKSREEATRSLPFIMDIKKAIRSGVYGDLFETEEGKSEV